MWWSSLRGAIDPFNRLHRLSESIYNGSGIWGDSQYGYRMALRDSYWRADVYGSRGDRLSQQRAAEAIDYLLSTQHSSGVFGFPADTRNPEYGATVTAVQNAYPQGIVDGYVVDIPGGDISELYYDHGYALTAVARAYLRTRDAGLLTAINDAATWCLDKPLTANINYLSALIKGLCAAYDCTADTDYIAHAVTLHDSVVAGMTDGQADDAHNAQLEYHAFICSGMIALADQLGSEPDGMDAAIDVLTSRCASESANSSSTWPGMAAITWRELLQYRALTVGERNALLLVRELLDIQVGMLLTSNTATHAYRKALSVCISVGY